MTWLPTADELAAAAAPLAEAWGDPLGLADAAARRAADAAVEGVIGFVCNGETPTRVGRAGVDWSGGHHRHQEWPAQLNRFFWLGPAAGLFRETGDARYALAARDLLADWLAAQRIGPGGWEMPSYDTVLNLGIRLGDSQRPGWLGTLPLWARSGDFDAPLLAQIIDSAAAQLDYLARHPAPAINWRIANADSLVVSSIRLAGHPRAAAWRLAGVSLLNDALRRQVLPDGAHYERTPGYHHWMLRVAWRFLRLARRMPGLGLAVSVDAVARMFDYGVATTRPNGDLCGLHDSQGWRLTPLPWPEPPQGDLLAQRAAFRAEAGLPAADPPASSFFPDAGQGFFRTGWTPDATYATFDATRWGGGHCHLSRNAVQLHAHGKTLLCDPGWLTYEESDPASAHGRSTRAHNTLNLRGYNQSATNPSLTYASHAPGYDLVRSDYEGGYWRGPFHWGYPEGMADGDWASHCRIMLFVHGLGLLVIDAMYRELREAPEPVERAPSVEANWQFCEGPALLDAGGRRAFTRHERGNLLLLFASQPEGARLSLHEGERDPRRGWLPGASGLVPAPQVCQTLPRMTGQYADFVTLALPFAGATPPAVSVEARPAKARESGGLILRGADGRVDEFRWMYRLDLMLGEQETGLGEVSTDATLIHMRYQDGEPLRGAVMDGTYLEPFAPARREVLGSFAFGPGA